MGRGLSKLQKSILVLALEKREERRGLNQYRYENRSPCVSDLYSPDILYAVYELGGGDPLPIGEPDNYDDWVPSLWGKAYRFDDPGPAWRRHPIDETQYRTAMAAISRSVSRLESRGLIKRSDDWERVGLTLTMPGEAVALGLIPKDRRDELAAAADGTWYAKGIESQTSEEIEERHRQWLEVGRALGGNVGASS